MSTYEYEPWMATAEPLIPLPEDEPYPNYSGDERYEDEPSGKGVDDGG